MTAVHVRRPVLVVDDEDAVRDVVAEALADEGYRVAQASNGQEALDAATSERPAVILLDMRMPVMDGWGFARAYRQAPGPHAPIVVVTATQNAKKWCEEIGGDECLPKPFEIEQLIDVVNRLARHGN
jgi:two-component system, chemotaxis family, chemotaxis protein CheY